MLIFKITNLNTSGSIDLLNENQIELMYVALSEYQDNIYDEDSPYYSSVDEADYSDLQHKLAFDL